MRMLGKQKKHQFTPEYSPHASETVEAVCKQVLRTARAILPDLGLQEEKWPTAMPLIKSLLNNTISKRLGDKTSLFFFSKQDSSNPLAKALFDYKVQPITLNFAQLQRISSIQNGTGAVEKIHREVAEATTRERRNRIAAHNWRTGVH